MDEFEKNSELSNQFFPVRGEQTYYEVLEIPADATKIQVREAYIRLKSTYSHGSQALYSLISEDDAKEILDHLEEAYRVLYDEILRKDYDRFIVGASRGIGAKPTTDPFQLGILAQEIDSQVERNDGEQERRHEPMWKSNLQEKVSVSAKKKRFADHALENDIQEKIKQRLEKGQIDGTLIKDLREIQGVSLNELQDRTKVSLQYIIALENNDFQTLPSIVYVKGFLKICLQYLGVQSDVELIVRKYLELIESWTETREIKQY